MFKLFYHLHIEKMFLEIKRVDTRAFKKPCQEKIWNIIPWFYDIIMEENTNIHCNLNQ